MDDVTGVGDFEVKAGWHVLNEPASTPEPWSAMKEDYDWTNKRLVHIWVLPYGWDSSSFNHQLRDEDGESIQFFLYARSRQMDSHELKVEIYGTDGQWVIIKNMSNEEKSEGEKSREKNYERTAPAANLLLVSNSQR